MHEELKTSSLRRQFFLLTYLIIFGYLVEISLLIFLFCQSHSAFIKDLAKQINRISHGFPHYLP